MTTPEATTFPTIEPATAEHDTDTFGGPEEATVSPEPSHEVSWPDNKVIKYSSGHTLEFNNTPNNEYIRIKHGTKRTKILFTKDGDIDIISEGDLYLKAREDHLQASKNRVEEVYGDYTLDVKGDYTVTVGGVMKFQLSDQIQIESFDGFKLSSVIDNEVFNFTLKDRAYNDTFFSEGAGFA